MSTGRVVGAVHAAVTFAPVHVRYIQLAFTANSGWPASQSSKLAIFS